MALTDKKKILFLSHTSGISGAEECLLTLVKYLDRERFEPLVVMPPPDGPLREAMEQLGVRVLVRPLRWWATAPSGNRLRELALDFYRVLVQRLGVAPRAPILKAYRSAMGLLNAPAHGDIENDLEQRVLDLEQIIREENIALVHSNTSVIWEGAFAASRAGVPHVWHLHEIMKGYPHLTMLLPLGMVYSVMTKLSDRVVTVSDAVRDSIPGAVSRRNLLTIPNGIDTQKTERFEAHDLRQELGLKSNAVVALAVGTLNKAKGYNYLLDAMVLVRQRNECVHLCLAGGGSIEEIEEFGRDIAARGLKDVVHALGYRHDVPALQKGCDFLVLSSVTESFSLAVAETMAVGKAVVATACGGPSEIVIEGETGFLVPPRDAAALAERILAMAADDKQRMVMGQAGRRRFEENYRAEVFAARFGALYDETIATIADGMKSNMAQRQRLSTALMQMYPHVSRSELAQLRKTLLWKVTSKLRRGGSTS